MMKRIVYGILCGAIAGIIDVIPMVLQKLPWNADISAFIMWVVVGFFLSTSSLKIRGPVKGIVVAFLVLAPNTFIIAAQEPGILIPISIMTLLLGSILGWVMEKIK